MPSFAVSYRAGQSMHTHSPPPSNDTQLPQDERLGSWKAIAAYVNRDVTTVQRWEKREGMPIHRHVHDKRGSVYAFRSELDTWMRQRRQQPVEPLSSDSLPSRWRMMLAVALVLAAGIALWLFTRSIPTLQEPLAGARVTPVTDFDGQEQAATISRDGKFVAFLSDREGAMDVWVTQLGTGQFRNLTRGQAPELLNPEVRSIAFTPDGSLVTFWTRRAGQVEPVNVWSVPTLGGALQAYRAGAVELDWSGDGRRVVFHTTAEGDPTFVDDAVGGQARQIHVASRGTHCHFQIWSPDERYIYFVRGVPPDRMDVWRMKPDGTDVERLTSHDAWIGHPVFFDEHTLLYLATAEDGVGPWLFALDVRTRASRRIGFGVEQYTSLAASADRRRWVVTVEHAKTSLWRVPISDDILDERAATRIALPTMAGHAPRVGAGYLLFVSSKGDGHGLWLLRDGQARELWSAPRTRLVGGPVIAPDGESVAFSAESVLGTRLYVLRMDEGIARMVAKDLDVRGSPAWSPDGHSLNIAAMADGGGLQLFTVTLDDAPPIRIHDGYALNPLWSPDGRFVVFADADVGPDFVLKAINRDGSAHPLPDITLPRGARRVSFVPGRQALIVVLGEMRHGNFWLIDLDSGQRRQLTNFSRDFSIRDFDVAPDGSEIVFDRRQDNSDVALIEVSHGDADG